MDNGFYELQALTLAEALKECRSEPGALCFDPKRPEIARRRLTYITAQVDAALSAFKLAEAALDAPAATGRAPV